MTNEFFDVERIKEDVERKKKKQHQRSPIQGGRKRPTRFHFASWIMGIVTGTMVTNIVWLVLS
jgi:hypothetical protein